MRQGAGFRVSPAFPGQPLVLLAGVGIPPVQEWERSITGHHQLISADGLLAVN